MLIVESLGLGVRYFRQTHWYPETVKRSCASSSCHWCKLMPGGVASWVQILPECSAVSSAVLQHVVNDCLWFSEGKPQTINNVRSRFPTWWDYPRAPRAQKKTLASPDPRRKIEALLTPLIGSCTSTPWSLAALWEQWPGRALGSTREKLEFHLWILGTQITKGNGLTLYWCLWTCKPWHPHNWDPAGGRKLSETVIIPSEAWI